MWLHLLIDVLVGAAAGLIAGLLGTGNSLVVLPALIFIFHATMASSVALPLAVGTNLAICGVSILVACIVHSRHQKTDWKIVKIIVTPYAIGSLVGPWVAHYLPAQALKTYIAIFIFFAAFTLLFKEKPAQEDCIPGWKNLFFSSLIVSFLSSISGMASGILMVPYLSWIGVPIKKAISIALPGAVIFSFVAMIGYLLSGLGNPALPRWSIGYIYLPTAVIISAAAALCSPYGVRLHHQLDIRKLKKLFALLLVIAGIATLSV
jgi:uncharacterized protein